MKKSILLSTAAALALMGGSASAAFINGSVSFSDGFDSLPTIPSTSIVSALTSFDVGALAAGSGGTGDLAGIPFANTAFDFDITSLPATMFDAGGFTFTLESTSNLTSSALACANGLCNDDIGFDIAGVVSGNGFDATAFSGTWTAQGSCAGDAGECTGDSTASWSASITALGISATPTPPPAGVPEPGPLALMGLGLLAMMRVGRRKA